ncbi:MAG: Rpn family recombination-promoting nuclease/putative transposase [Succinivibrio sp.]|jgi:predicted transposase/invertase (TIGR01784 family)|nr:Rpn family recombination-promoting nuclease/putative transposase [Succinivibrio sp.]
MADEQSLTITSDYMFKKVFGQKPLAKQLIEKILKIRISDIEEIQTEKAVDGGPHERGVRYDIWIKDAKNTRIDVEMQSGGGSEEILALRSRYYQSRLDQDTLKPGEPYPELGNSYIIFLCDFAIFRGTRCRYTFRDICEEDKSITLEDRAWRIFVSSKGGRGGETDQELLDFLDYINGQKPKGRFACKINEEVSKINRDPKTKEERKMAFIMLKEEHDKIFDDGKAKGIEIGEKRGEEKTIKSCILGMLKKKMSLKDISEVNSASADLIRKIAKENGLSCDY